MHCAVVSAPVRFLLQNTKYCGAGGGAAQGVEYCVVELFSPVEHCSSGAFFSPLRSSGAFLDTQVSLEPTPVSRLGSQLVGWSATLFHSVCLSGLVGQKTAQTCLIRSVPDLCVFKRCAFFFSVLNIVERGSNGGAFFLTT